MSIFNFGNGGRLETSKPSRDCPPSRSTPDKSCQLNRSMQHHLISWPDNTSPQEPALFAGTQSELNRAVFRLNQFLRLLRVDFEQVLRRPIETTRGNRITWILADFKFPVKR